MAAVHTGPHLQAGQTVTLRPGVMLWDHPRKEYVDGAGLDCVLEDWADRLLGCSWTDDFPLRLVIRNYERRVWDTGLPEDDEVVGVRANGLSHLVHVSELAEWALTSWRGRVARGDERPAPLRTSA